MTTSCSTSTAASGSATRPLPGAADAVAALREAGKSVLFLTNDVRHPPEGFVRKLWRLGFQASLDEVLSVGAARAVLARRAQRRRHGLRRRLPGARRPRRRRRPADRQQHRVRDPRRRRRRRRPRRPRLRGAQDRHPGRDPRRRADRRHPRRQLPDARRPVARHRRRPRRDRGRRRAQGRRASSASPRRAMYAAALRPPRRAAACSASATASTSTSPARAAPGLDSALVLTGARRAQQADAAQPRPTFVADSLAEARRWAT